MQSEKHFSWNAVPYFLVGVGVSVLVGCDKPRNSSADRPVSGTPILAATSTPAVQVPVTGETRRLEDVGSKMDAPQRTQRDRQFARDIYRMSFQRNGREIARVLREEEQILPEEFPPYKDLPNDKNAATLGRMRLLLRYVILSDTDNSRAEADAFIKRFRDKYAASETGRLLLEGFESELKMAYADLKNDFVPWKLGMPSLDK